MKSVHKDFYNIPKDLNICKGHEALGKDIRQSPEPRRKDQLADPELLYQYKKQSPLLMRHILLDREAGATEDEIKQACSCLSRPRVPTFMEAYTVYKNLG